jgi:hypothetical protein
VRTGFVERKFRGFLAQRLDGTHEQHFHAGCCCGLAERERRPDIDRAQARLVPSADMGKSCKVHHRVGAFQMRGPARESGDVADHGPVKHDHLMAARA